MHPLQRRLALLVLLATTLAGLVVPASAAAWNRERGVPLIPHGRATWYSQSPAWRDEMHQVARYLVATGARVTFTEVRSPTAANVVLMRPGGMAPCTGVTSIRWSGSKRYQSTIKWGVCASFGRSPILQAEQRQANLHVLLHESLHFFGLDHETRRCALMNPYGTSHDGVHYPYLCTIADVQHAGWSYCAPYEADDRTGLLALYGGHARALPARTCRRTAMRAPSTIDVTPVAAGPDANGYLHDASLQVSWSGGVAGMDGMRVVARPGTCPTDSEIADPSGTFADTAQPVTGSTTINVDQTGPWCVAAAPFLNVIDDSPYVGMYATRTVTVPDPTTLQPTDPGL